MLQNLPILLNFINLPIFWSIKTIILLLKLQNIIFQDKSEKPDYLFKKIIFVIFIIMIIMKNIIYFNW